MNSRFKDIALGAGIGLGIGMLLLGGIALLALPHYRAAMDPLPSTREATAVLLSATPAQPATATSLATPSPVPTRSPIPTLPLTPTVTTESLTHVVR